MIMMPFLVVFVVALASNILCSAASTEDISIKTLPPDYARPVLESADALLSDWEGEHRFPRKRANIHRILACKKD